MAFFKSMMRNIGYFGKQVNPNIPSLNNDIGLSYGENTADDREAVYPAWFFSSRLGQPRQVDTVKIRELAQSPWIQMVINTFKKQVETTQWEVVAEDEEDETDRSEDIKKCVDFFKKINKNGQSVDDINSEMITDIAEIDAGCFNYIYSADSYTIGDVPRYDAWGRVVGFDVGLILKPLGQRELVGVKTVDGSSMLKQVDIHKNLLNFWQYSFKHPSRNPTRFEKEEIEYIIMNSKPYSIYGFSPVQAIQQVIELLIQGTRYNKDLYTNNAIPDILISLPKLPNSQLAILKRKWNEKYKGKPHQVGFINWMIDKVTKLADNNRDLEWLDGQKWYFRIAFGVYGVSPEEAGFTQDSTKATGDAQERTTVRNALKPYLNKFNRVHSQRTITEILGREDHGLIFRYTPKDHAQEIIEFTQNMAELDHGTLTINEFRRMKGREPTEWGDDPLRRPMDPNAVTMFGNENRPKNPVEDNQKNDKFKKQFEVFLNGK